MRGLLLKDCHLHRNIPKMLTSYGAVASLNVNISDLVNKSRGEYAYTVIDVDASINGKSEELRNIDGVLR